MNVLVPQRLKKGDCIGIISPASPVADASRIERGVRYLEGLGYRTKLGDAVYRRKGYLAGTDDERAGDIHAMFRDKNVRAIFCARGGYGSPRLLSKIDYRIVGRNPKIFLGYSDVTALSLAFWKKCRLVTYHGPMLAVDLQGDVNAFAEESLWRTLASPGRNAVLAASEAPPAAAHASGTATGRLLGGNLSLVVSLLGTPYMPDLRGALLFLEEIGEDPYRVDRMLTQIRNAGVFTRASGLALGHFTDCVPRDPAAPTIPLQSILAETAAAAGTPVLGGFPFGHEKPMATLPVGLRARLDAGKGVITLLEPSTS
jgi:muramoyltetrapeptide carboxypeptidase